MLLNDRTSFIALTVLTQGTRWLQHDFSVNGIVDTMVKMFCTTSWSSSEYSIESTACIFLIVHILHESCSLGYQKQRVTSVAESV